MNDCCTAWPDLLALSCARHGDRSNDRGVVHAPGRSRVGPGMQVIRITRWSEDWMGDQRQDARFDARTPDRLRVRRAERRVYAGEECGGRPSSELYALHRSSESHSHGEAFGPGAQCCCAECANNAIGGTSFPVMASDILHARVSEESGHAC